MASKVKITAPSPLNEIKTFPKKYNNRKIIRINRIVRLQIIIITNSSLTVEKSDKAV